MDPGICLLLEKKVKNAWLRHGILLVSALPGLFFVRTEDYFTSLGLLAGLIAAIHFEEKFVNFRDTRNIWAMIVRVAGAFAVYYALNTLLKLPFSKHYRDRSMLRSLFVQFRCYRFSLAESFLRIPFHPPQPALSSSRDRYCIFFCIL